jgi:hypothetical protein
MTSSPARHENDPVTPANELNPPGMMLDVYSPERGGGDSGSDGGEGDSALALVDGAGSGGGGAKSWATRAAKEKARPLSDDDEEGAELG